MTDVKVYYPEVIPDTPFPSVDTEVATESGDTYTPDVIADNPMPSTTVADDVVNSNINTQTRKILQEFRFSPTGALQVGQYKLNSSGDIRISPNGIVGRNDGGTNTFTIDATTGDSTFMGKLMAGTLIGGDSKVIIDSVGGNGRILVYDDSSTCRIVIGYVP